MSHPLRFGLHQVGDLLAVAGGLTVYSIDPAEASAATGSTRVAVCLDPAADRATQLGASEAALGASTGDGVRLIDVGTHPENDSVYLIVELPSTAAGAVGSDRIVRVLEELGVLAVGPEQAWLDGVDAEVLYADAIVAATPDTDELLRYVEEPGAMSEVDRDVIERYLAASPFHQTRLELLRARIEDAEIEGDAAQPMLAPPTTAQALWAEAAIADRGSRSADPLGDQPVPSTRVRRMLLIAAIAIATGWLSVLLMR